MQVVGSTIAPPTSRAWFERGCDAFKKTFPEIAAKIPLALFYVCPLCLKIYTEQALLQRILTREHVPPESLGGRRLALTCEPCNSGGGHAADSHARREADLIGFFRGTVSDIKATLRTKSGRMPVRLFKGEGGVQMFGVGKAASKVSFDAVQSDFMSATGEGNWQDFKFNVEFQTFSPDRAAASWLRSAYLAYFAALGYRFICRAELDTVRARIKNPEMKEPATFRLIRPERSEPTLVRVEEPESLRSYMMLYEHHAVFLPRYGDHDFYAGLATQSAGQVNFSGKQYPWPSSGPTFFHDFPPGTNTLLSTGG
jgi:hypothetical protein